MIGEQTLVGCRQLARRLVSSQCTRDPFRACSARHCILLDLCSEARPGRVPVSYLPLVAQKLAQSARFVISQRAIQLCHFEVGAVLAACSDQRQRFWVSPQMLFLMSLTTFPSCVGAERVVIVIGLACQRYPIALY